jgi:hypothetical protein
MMRRARRIAGALVLALAGVVSALAVGEVVLRATGLGHPGLYIYDPVRGWALKPNARQWRDAEGHALVEVNRFGFRGPDVTLAKPPGTYRIAVLGDSFTEAAQVAYDQTFSAVAERELARCPAVAGRKVQALDFGVDGYGTAQELLTLEDVAERFAPDAVVLAFFSGNDVRNNSVVLEGDKCRPFYVYRDGVLVPGGPFVDSLSFRRGCRMRFESRELAVLNVLGSIHGVIMRVRRWLRSERPQAGRTAREEPGLDVLVYKPPATPVWRDAWKVTEGLIELTHLEARRHGSRFLLVTLSTPMQDDPNPASLARFIRRIGVPDLSYPDRRLKALGERDGFPVLNLAPALGRYARAHDVFLHGFANTRMGIGHWNTEGHRLAGELIAKWLCAELAVRPTPKALCLANPRAQLRHARSENKIKP